MNLTEPEIPLTITVVESGDWHRYYPISDTDRAWGVYVTCGGYLRAEPHGAYPPSEHPQKYSFDYDTGRVLNEYQLHYITRGRGSIQWGPDKRTVSIDAGDAFLLFPGVWHRYRPDPTSGWDEYWVGFGGTYAERIMQPPFFSVDDPHVPVAEGELMLDGFTDLVSAMHSHRPALHQLLGSMTIVLLARLQSERVVTEVGGPSAERVIRVAKRTIAHKMTENISGKELADELKVEYDWLRRSFKRHTGFTLHQYHAELRVQRAIELLETTVEPVGDIAREVGYEDPFHFSRVFKRIAGVSPAQWRQRRDEELGSSQ